MSGSAPTSGLIPEPLRGRLAALRRRLRLYVLLTGALRVLAWLVVLVLLQLLLDRTLRLTVDVRVLVNLVITAIVLVACWRRLVAPLLTPIDDTVLARLIDRRFPALKDRLSTAVQFLTTPAASTADSPSPELARVVVAEAVDSARQTRLQDVLDHRGAQRRGAGLLGLILAVGALALVAPITMKTWLQRNWLLQDVPWPQQTYLLPEKFDAAGRRRFPLGDELEITIQITGRTPSSATLEWASASGQRGREPLTLVGGRMFVAQMGVLTEPLRFHLRGGDERTREYFVDPVERPAVVGSIARITPPAYVGLEPTELEQQTALEMLAGSQLELDVRLNKPVAAVRLIGPAGEAAVPQRIGSDRVQASFEARQSGSYHFELIDADGWEDKRPLRYALKVLADQPPEVALTAEGVDEIITPVAEIPLELRARDAYGLASVRLVAQRDEEPPGDVTLPTAEPGARTFAAASRIAVASLQAQPGARLRFSAEASDSDPAGPNVGRSQVIELRVVSAEEFMREMARREQDARREFDQLISAQRGVKDAAERLLAGLDPGTPPTAEAQRLIALARRQEAQVGRTRHILERLSNILNQMRSSRVARSEDERRMLERVTEPLAQLMEEVIPSAAGDFSELRGQVTDEKVAQARRRQDQILREMNEIQGNLLEAEGFREAVAQLRELLTRQEELRASTLRGVESDLESILGDLPGSGDAHPPP